MVTGAARLFQPLALVDQRNNHALRHLGFQFFGVLGFWVFGFEVWGLEFEV